QSATGTEAGRRKLAIPSSARLRRYMPSPIRAKDDWHPDSGQFPSRENWLGTERAQPGHLCPIQDRRLFAALTTAPEAANFDIRVRLRCPRQRDSHQTASGEPGAVHDTIYLSVTVH